MQVKPGGPYFCALYAPTDESGTAVHLFDSCYGWGEAGSPEDAIYEARQKMWKGL